MTSEQREREAPWESRQDCAMKPFGPHEVCDKEQGDGTNI